MAPARTCARAYGGTLAGSMNEVVSQIFVAKRERSLRWPVRPQPEDQPDNQTDPVEGL